MASFDALAGWDEYGCGDNHQDQRLVKYIRAKDSKVSRKVLVEKFELVEVFKLPVAMMLADPYMTVAATDAYMTAAATDAYMTAAATGPYIATTTCPYIATTPDPYITAKATATYPWNTNTMTRPYMSVEATGGLTTTTRPFAPRSPPSSGPYITTTDGSCDVVGNSDTYEAFWRTRNVTIRGVFVNGEPVWGTAEYHNGMSYVGMFAGCIPHGFGEKRAGASVYKGRFHQGRRHGRGLLLDAAKHRIYVGWFEDDFLHGQSICVNFTWSVEHNLVTHSRYLMTHEHGVRTKCGTTTQGDVTVFSGLAHEEFLKFYRECEKSVEVAVGRKRLREVDEATECLWKPVGEDEYMSHMRSYVAPVASARRRQWAY